MEQVFVVDRRDYFGGRWPQGFLPVSTAPDLLAEFARRGRFAPRSQAEQQPEWKQLIPYCVVRRPDQVFCVQRKSAQLETRLHGKLSIGIGGHVNPIQPDTVVDEVFLRRSLERELAEELEGVDGRDPQAHFLGFLNDDSNAVGQVHLGLVYAIDLPARSTAPVRVREISKMIGGFRSLAELRPLWQDPDRFESWSGTLIRAGVAGPITVNRSGRPGFARSDNEEFQQ